MNTASKKQSGFTLVELMIVVTIIGILASIAVPAYRDYTIRARVAECASVYGPLKTAVSMYYSNNAALPATLAALAESQPVPSTKTSYKGDYVSLLDVTKGSVDCTLKANSALGDASSDNVFFKASASGGTLNWSVKTASSDVPDKYLPSQN